PTMIHDPSQEPLNMTTRTYPALIRPPQSPSPFPYTTLFRSRAGARLEPPPRGAESGRVHAHPDRDLLNTGRVRLSPAPPAPQFRSEEHTSELQSLSYIVSRLLLVKKTNNDNMRLLEMMTVGT